MSKNTPPTVSEQWSDDFAQLSSNSGKLLPELKTHQLIFEHLMEGTFETVFDEAFDTHRKNPLLHMLPLTILNYANNVSCLYSAFLDVENDTEKDIHSFMVGISIRGHLSVFNDWLQDSKNREAFNQICDDYLEWIVGIPLDDGVIHPGLAMSTETVARLNAQMRFQHLMEMTAAIYTSDKNEIVTTLNKADKKSLITSSSGILMTVGTIVASKAEMQNSNYMKFLNGETDSDLLSQCNRYWEGMMKSILPEHILELCLPLPPKRLNASIADNVFFEFLMTMENDHKNSIGMDVYANNFSSPLIPLVQFSPCINENVDGLLLTGMDNQHNKHLQKIPLFIIESLDLTGLRSAFHEHVNRVKNYMNNRKPDRDTQPASPTYN